MKEIILQPYVMIFLTLGIYEVFIYICRRIQFHLIHPQLLAILFLMSVLYWGEIDFTFYKRHTEIISFLLGPATVALAIPLYRQWTIVKRYWFPLLVGLGVGSLLSVLLIGSVAYVLHFDQTILISLLPKSVTMPIGLELTRTYGGIEAITVLAIIVTGLTGASTAPVILRLMKINNPIAKGAAIGMSSHALGTARALEMGETEGAVSSVSLALTGIFTVFWMTILSYFWTFS